MRDASTEKNGKSLQIKNFCQSHQSYQSFLSGNKMVPATSRHFRIFCSRADVTTMCTVVTHTLSERTKLTGSVLIFVKGTLARMVSQTTLLTTTHGGSCRAAEITSPFNSRLLRWPLPLRKLKEMSLGLRCLVNLDMITDISVITLM